MIEGPLKKPQTFEAFYQKMNNIFITRANIKQKIRINTKRIELTQTDTTEEDLEQEILQRFNYHK
ncbi:MAG: hypothetical protein QMO91_00880 [Candidatus Tisiphia sp.]|nr:hypothetical protein [Candidatus Tisiphia sp.]